MNPTHCLALIFTVLLNPFSGSMAAYAADAIPVAGLTPWQRPVGAPRVTAPPLRDSGRALHGVSAPIPSSLKFLGDQGSWYTPFIEPGMSVPYDLRGWHSQPSTPR